ICIEKTAGIDLAHQTETDDSNGSAHCKTPSGLCMRILPVQLARFAVERSGLQRSVIDAVDRHDLGVIAGRENLISVLHVVVGQNSFDDVHAGIAQKLDDTLSSDAVEKRSIWRWGEDDTLLSDENVGGGKLGHVSQQIEHNAVSEATRVGFKKGA